MAAGFGGWLGLSGRKLGGDAVHAGLAFGKFAIARWLRLAKLQRMPVGNAAGVEVAQRGFQSGQVIHDTAPAAAEVRRGLERAKLAKRIRLGQAAEVGGLRLAKRVGVGFSIDHMPQLEAAVIDAPDVHLSPGELGIDALGQGGDGWIFKVRHRAQGSGGVDSINRNVGIIHWRSVCRAGRLPPSTGLWILPPINPSDPSSASGAFS